MSTPASRTESHGDYKSEIGVEEITNDKDFVFIVLITIFIIFSISAVIIVKNQGINSPGIHNNLGKKNEITKTKDPQTDPTEVNPIGDRDGIKDHKGKEKNQKALECTPKEHIKNAKDLAEKYKDRINNNKTFHVRKLKRTLGCIPKKGIKLIQWCEESNLKGNACFYIVARSGEKILNYTFSKPETPPEKTNGSDKEPEEVQTKPDQQSIESTTKKPIVKENDGASTPKSLAIQKDFKKIAKMECIKRGRKRSDLQGIELKSLILVNETEKEIQFEWQNNKGKKTTCIYYLESSGTVIG